MRSELSRKVWVLKKPLEYNLFFKILCFWPVKVLSLVVNKQNVKDWVFEFNFFSWWDGLSLSFGWRQELSIRWKIFLVCCRVFILHCTLTLWLTIIQLLTELCQGSACLLTTMKLHAQTLLTNPWDRNKTNKTSMEGRLQPMTNERGLVHISPKFLIYINIWYFMLKVFNCIVFATMKFHLLFIFVAHTFVDELT